MPDFDPSAQPEYNSMQQQLGLLPPAFQPPPVIFPNQVSAAIAQGCVGNTAFLSQVGSSGPQFANPATGMGFGSGAPSGQQFVTQGSPGWGFGAGAFLGQQLQTFTNQNPMFQGPTGIMMPMTPAASFNTYPNANPYAGLAAQGPYQGPPGLFTPLAPAPPPVYSRQLGPMPFTPPPASAQFNTAYAADIERGYASDDAMYGRKWSGGGVGARIATDFTGGAAGAALGRRVGGRYGALIGGIGGFLASEFSGAGQVGQNAFMNQVAFPEIQERAMAGGIQELSRSFVTGGDYLGPTGAGFTQHASREAASQLKDLAESRTFQQQTSERFNQQDLMRITQEAGRNDMMTGVQSPTQMKGRVREIAKSLSSFMELAQEPDIQRAIQTMGQLRASGLNLAETNQAVAQGRTFARMAGQSFSDIVSQAGGMGSQTFQSMGLSQGLGLQTGMMNYALARATQTGGTLNPQMMSLLGGAQGYANMNNLTSASMLQMPMLAPSIMSSAGGINQGALQSVMGGQTSPFSQTSMATSAIQSMTQRQGVGGLAAAIALQPMMQDTMGRMLQAQGPFAQRNFEDRNLLNTMRAMPGVTGSGGFMLAAQGVGGMTQTQAAARAQELGSPGYWDRQRQQIEVDRREGRRAELDRREAARPTWFQSVARDTGLDDIGILGHQISRRFSQQFEGDEYSDYKPSTDAERRQERSFARSREYANYAQSVGREVERRGERGPGLIEGVREAYGIQQGTGYTGIVAGLNALYTAGTPSSNAIAQDFREGSRLSGLMTSTGNRESDRAMASMTRTFGGTEAQRIQAGMTSNLLGQLDQGPLGLGSTGRGIVNGLFRTAPAAAATVSSGGVAGFIAGMFDPGSAIQSTQLTASGIRSSFLDAAGKEGSQARRRAEEFWNRNPSTAIQAVSSDIQQFMRPEQQQALFDSAERSRGLGGGRGAAGEVIREQTTQARRELFGEDSGRLQAQFQRELGNVRGQGAEGSRANTTSRQYIVAAASLAREIRHAPPEEKTRIMRQFRELQNAARRQGVNINTDINNQVTAESNRMESGPGADMAAAIQHANRGRTGAQLMETVGRSATTMQGADILQREAGGMATLAAGGGALGDVLKSAGADDPSKYNQARVMAAIQGMSQEQVRSLSADQQAIVRRIQRGGTAGAAAINELGSGAGQRAADIRTAYRRDQEKSDPLSRWFNRSILGNTEERAIMEGVGRTTDADRRADERTAIVNATQRAAESAGIGRTGDPMLQAASELRQAAEALKGVVQGGALDRAVAGDPAS